MSHTSLVLRLAVVCGGGALWVGVAHVQPARQRETLHGLQGVAVVMGPLPPDLERTGLRRSHLQTAVERQLRAAGIGVQTLEERRHTPGRAFLYVNVNTTRGEGGV